MTQDAPWVWAWSENALTLTQRGSGRAGRSPAGPPLSWAARPAAHDCALAGGSIVNVAPCTNVGYDH